MMIALEARPEPSRLMAWASPLLAAAATVVAGFVLFSLLGKNPVDAFFVFFVEPVATRYGVGELLLKASPLMLCALGLAIGYRANVWNIGAEGQLTIGAICGGGLALWLPQLNGALLLPLMIAAGAAGGIAWAAIPAWLRTRFNANEILTSLMLVYIATAGAVVPGPGTVARSRRLQLSAVEPVRRQRAASVAASPARGSTSASCSRSRSSRQAGCSPRARSPDSGCASQDWRRVRQAMPAFPPIGPCGSACWSAARPRASPASAKSRGRSGSCCLRYRPVTVSPRSSSHSSAACIRWASLLASLLMSLLYLGGEAAQIGLELPSAVTRLFQGMLLFFLLAADVFIGYRLRFRRSPAPRRRQRSSLAR